MSVRIVNALGAATCTDAGRQREVNEDRSHIDVARGIFIVIDGVGGQAAGGKAADVALAMLRTRLERETGPTSERVREAIAIANNEIYRLASTRSEWSGMGCVLTVAVVEDGVVTVGHVGDTRLYKCRHDRIEKVTRDHSPVGEREDAHDLSESEAMRHPRRNEVYRDVGSDPHQADDPEFIELRQIEFEPDAALLLCSDGLSDLVDSATIAGVIGQFAGDPETVARALVRAANDAGGKDNVTVVYVEGERFAASQREQAPLIRSPRADVAQTIAGASRGRPDATTPVRRPGTGGPRLVRAALVLLLLAAAGVALVRARIVPWPPSVFFSPVVDAVVAGTGDQIVGPTGSIAAAIERAAPGSQVVVEPGEYREQLRLRDRVRVVSRVPRAATIRLPATSPEGAAAVVADGLSSGGFAGFNIVGDAATPLGIALLVANSALSITDVEISGATIVGIEFADGNAASLSGSDIHDNPGAALAIRSGASPRIVHNWFSRNGTSERAPRPFTIDAGAAPRFERNVFQGTMADGLAPLTREVLKKENLFLDSPPVVSAPAPARPHRGR